MVTDRNLCILHDPPVHVAEHTPAQIAQCVADILELVPSFPERLSDAQTPPETIAAMRELADLTRGA
jgi:hypothetical protein